jgi:rod shape-determining protein MreC
LLIILLVTSLFLITLDLRGVSLTKGSRSVSQTTLAPVQRTVSDIFSPVGRFFSDIKNFGKTKAELNNVLALNKQLEAALAGDANLRGQLLQLKGVLDLAGRGGYKVVAARVIGRGSAATFSETITLDQGSSAGIRSDMSVISANGLVGLVKEVTANSSIVQLISDPNFKVGVLIARSQSVGILQGQGGSSYSLQLLDPSGTILVGDKLLTNGSDQNHPFVPGVPVGQVTWVDHTTSTLTQSGSVKGYANLEDLGVVSVILSAPTTAPSTPLVPTPQPTVTVYVTAPPAPVATGLPVPGSTTAPTPTPAPTRSK